MTKFINPTAVIAQTGIKTGEIVADLGCGGGFYVLPASQLVGNSGLVYAVDLMESKLAATASIAGQFGYKNIKYVHADLRMPLKEVPPDSCDMVITSNILHEVHPVERLLGNVYAILKTGGRLLVVEWQKKPSPLGPPLSIRIDPQELEILAMGMGLRRIKSLDTDPFHYAEIYTK